MENRPGMDEDSESNAEKRSRSPSSAPEGDPVIPSWRSDLMREQAKVFRRRHIVRNEVVPGLIGFVTFWAWEFSLSHGVRLLERNSSVDPFTWLNDRVGTPVALLLALLIGPITGIALSLNLAYWLMFRRMRRLIAWYRDTPACVYCDYDLSAVEVAEDGTRLCPECGRRVLPLQARPHAWHGIIPG